VSKNGCVAKKAGSLLHGRRQLRQGRRYLRTRRQLLLRAAAADRERGSQHLRRQWIQTDGSSTLTPTSGDAVLGINLSSRVYLTGNSASPRPTRVSGSCSYGPGTTCTGVGRLGTTLDCPPAASGFLAPRAVNLTPLATGPSITSAADGNFCPGPQRSPGAFGKPTARAIQQTGSPAAT
jgi:hypothetical protein